MTHPQIKPMKLTRFALMAAALVLAGCDRDQVKVQQVPKDADHAGLMSQDANAQMPANPHAGMDMSMGMGGGEARPKLKYMLPSGWKEKDLGQMRVASFEAPAKDGKASDVSVIPLGAMPASAELDNLNMWRKAVGLPEVDKVESEPVTIGSAQGKLYDVSGDKATGHIVVAVLDKDGMSWYFKMTGTDAGVREQKPAFLDFLKSVSFEAAPAAAANPHGTMPMMGMGAGTTPTDAPVTPAASGAPVPAGWKEVAPTQFLLAKYVIQGSGDAKAEASVSTAGGGTLANVNRWRGQLGLAQLSEEDFSKQAQSIDVGGMKGTMVQMEGTDGRTGKKARLVGIIVPGPVDTWFYKLMGDPQIVDQQKDAFTKFIQAAKFSNAN
jgi:hypothetical protein